MREDGVLSPLHAPLLQQKQKQKQGHKGTQHSSDLNKFLAEFLGTFVFLLLGLGATTSSVVTGAQSGIWQSAVVWGIAVTLCIYATGDISGGHLNPAVSLTKVLVKQPSSHISHFSWRECAYYSIAQVLGSIAAAALNLALWSNFIADFERKNNITRGSPGSEVSAMVFCDYFPNVSLYPPGENSEFEHLMSPLGALGIEMLATGLLLFVVFAISDPVNKAAVGSAGPVLVGAMVAVLISTIGPLTQAGLNPARDFGPRVVAWLAGWGSIAFPGPQQGFWLYILGPLAGGPLGALLYIHGLRHSQHPVGEEQGGYRKKDDDHDPIAASSTFLAVGGYVDDEGEREESACFLPNLHSS